MDGGAGVQRDFFTHLRMIFHLLSLFVFIACGSAMGMSFSWALRLQEAEQRRN